MTKVSIIVPIYNGEDYIEKCLDSLISQTLNDIEIIVVNDGSTDKSQLIINEYLNKDDRIKSYTKPNGGLGDARNFGISKANGEYIGFVDSDDYVAPFMYEKLYNEAIKSSSDVVESNFVWVYPNKERLDNASYFKNNKDLFLNIRVIVTNKIFSKSLIDKYNINFPVALLYEDILFTYKVLAHTNNISFIEDITYYYVQRPSSLSNFQTSRVSDIFKIFEKLIEYYKLKEVYDQNASRIEYLFVRYLMGSSLLRIIKIKDHKLRNKILKDNWIFLDSYYPSWKNNIYLQNKGLRNFYYRSINKITYWFLPLLFKYKK
jgi:glycosyltransferase involved in cell wall biosynthesis